jgi:hypothetical protein
MWSIQQPAHPASYSFIRLFQVSLLLGLCWGFVQVFCMPILPYFYAVWWIASAGVQFLIGRFLAQKLPIHKKMLHHISSKYFVLGMLLCFIAYFAAQVVVPLAVQGAPMAIAQTPFLSPIIIECIIFASGLLGFYTTLRTREIR